MKNCTRIRSFASRALVTLGLVLVSAGSPALAKQCVWNKGGFVLRVDWFTPGSYTIEKGYDDTSYYRFKKKPVQIDKFPLAQGKCIDKGTTTSQAIISVCGTVTASAIIEYPDDWPSDTRIDCAIRFRVTPPTDRWLDIWGTTLEPVRGPGGTF